MGGQLRLRFEGVDSAFHVWLNGNEVGYSQGARNPSEFDITDKVTPDAENTLAVRVYQFSDGSYIEDQGRRVFLNLRMHPNITFEQINGGCQEYLEMFIFSPFHKTG